MSNWHNEHIMQWYRRRIKAIINSYEVEQDEQQANSANRRND